MKAFRPSVTLLVLLVLMAAPLQAEKLYTYRNKQGALVFSDRPLGYGAPVAVKQVRVGDYQGSFSLRATGSDENSLLQGVNGYHGPVQVKIALEEARNIITEPPLPASFVLPPLGERNLVRLRRAEKEKGSSYRYNYSFVPGDPKAVHSPEKPYLLPLPPGRTFTISQGFEGTTSHNGPRNRYAVDIAMPEGTAVHAARGGVLMEVADDFFTGGFNRDRYGRRANFIRILHDDGTMAIYAHLRLETVRYPPGARVKAGDVIAESGNTGYTSGPHLHFAVQKNSGMAIRSVPFSFAGVSGPFTPRKGMQVQAN